MPRASDRLRFTGALLAGHGVRLLRNVVVAAALVYGLGWGAAGGGPIVGALAAVVLALVLAWTVWLMRWAAGERWTEQLLDLPRRRQAIPGPSPGTWATDVVADDGRYAVLLLHFGVPGEPTPSSARGVPDAPWGPGAVTAGRVRTIVAFAWADDEVAARAVARRLSGGGPS